MNPQRPDRNRIGEKIAWIGGGVGSVLWIGIIAIILLVEEKYTGGILGIILISAGLLSVFVVAPWRYPNLKYRILFLPLYTVLILSVFWAFVFLENSSSDRSDLWGLLVILPLLVGLISPVFTIGKKTWNEGK